MRSTRLVRKDWGLWPHADWSTHGRGTVFLAVALCIATVILVAFGDQLTRTSFRLNAAKVGDRVATYSFDDRMMGGDSLVQIDKGEPLLWRCSLGTRIEHGFCGFGLALIKKGAAAGVDLTRFDTVKLRFRYEGPGSFARISIKNTDDGCCQTNAHFSPIGGSVSLMSEFS